MIDVRPCTCTSEYQDTKYGKGKRVKNERIKGMRHAGWTCTVCGKKDET